MFFALGGAGLLISLTILAACLGLGEDWQDAGGGVEENRFLCLAVPVSGFFHPSLKHLMLAAVRDEMDGL